MLSLNLEVVYHSDIRVGVVLIHWVKSKYAFENLKRQNLDAVITPTKNLELPLVGSFVRGADVIPKLINKFNPKYILSSTVGGDAKYSGFLNNFISVEEYKKDLNCNLINLDTMQSFMI